KTIKYSDITGVWYTEEYIQGAKVAGFNSAKLMVGKFKNEALGTYDRYTYTGNNSFVVVETTDEKGEYKYTVIGAMSFEKTEKIYEKFKGIGKYELSYTDEGFTVTPSYGDAVSVKYSEIGGALYREEYIDGEKKSGFESNEVMMGEYSNDEFGKYKRFTNLSNDAYVIVEIIDGEDIVDYVVINADSLEATRELYNELTDRIAG
ncbi:MAG: hypothetical protein IKU19_01000, partial [Clostridia bacterium]|nr:hypothetical protein [Clostridia bacterium]